VRGLKRQAYDSSSPVPSPETAPQSIPTSFATAREHAAVRTDLKAIFVSLELSRSTWVITSLSPGGGEKMSKHAVPSGDIPALLARLSQLKEKARARTGQVFPIIVIQEAGLDGFWIHRFLEAIGVRSHVVDSASIEVRRGRRRRKTDRLDLDALLRLETSNDTERRRGVRGFPVIGQRQP
jgi:transposase